MCIRDRRLTQKIKDLETALTEAGVEHDKLEKQLLLADSESAKAMVYICLLYTSRCV